MTDLSDFKSWMVDRELASNTIDIYLTGMQQFFSEFSNPTKENGMAWKQALLERGIKPTTVNLRLCAFNAYCKMKGLPVEIKRMKIQQRNSVENVISMDEYERLLDGLRKDKNWKWYWNCKLLAATGCRVSEFVRLKKSDYDRGYAELWTKGKIRRIYIPESFRRESSSYYADFEPGEKLVQGRSGEITTRGVSSQLQNMAKRYGIEKEVMHPHAFRHMFAVEFLRRNNNLSLLADVLGHSSVSTTAIYTRMTKEQQAAAIDAAVDW